MDIHFSVEKEARDFDHYRNAPLIGNCSKDKNHSVPTSLVRAFPINRKPHKMEFTS